MLKNVTKQWLDTCALTQVQRMDDKGLEWEELHFFVRNSEKEIYSCK
jgi:hypothetical protein